MGLKKVDGAEQSQTKRNIMTKLLIKQFFSFFTCGSFKLSNKYAAEWFLFHKLRSFSDGVSFVDFDITLDLYKDDHKPSFRVFLLIANYTILELNVYNTCHVN